MSLTACAGGDAGALPSPEEVPEAERFGGTAVVSYSVSLQTLGVLHTIDALAMQVERELLFMPLVRWDEEMEPAPWLAERWDTTRVTPDSLELTFHLRRDVRWARRRSHHGRGEADVRRCSRIPACDGPSPSPWTVRPWPG